MFQRLLLSDGPSLRDLSSAALPDYFEQVFFHSPWHDEELPPLVYQESDGRIIGFLGVVSRRMSLRDRPIRMAISFHLMVESGEPLFYGWSTTAKDFFLRATRPVIN